MTKMLNLIVATALEELRDVDPSDWEIAIPIRPEESGRSFIPAVYDLQCHHESPARPAQHRKYPADPGKSLEVDQSHTGGRVLEFTRRSKLPQPPETPKSPEPPAEVNTPRADGMESRAIIVTDVKTLKTDSGRNNQPWVLSKVLDELGEEYTTFVGHKFELGRRYGILFKEIQQGKFTQRRIEDMTPLEEDDEVRF